MEHKIKQNITLVAERYRHEIRYEQRHMLIESDQNSIQIKTEKEDFIISYNTEFGTEELKCSTYELYDIILTLFTRFRQERIQKKNGFLLSLKRYFMEEGKLAIRDWERLKFDLENTTIDARILSGNRIDAEYYKGVIILKDDLRLELGNIVPFE